jgi:mitochondrial import inner membrane translocase subunit TIM23
MADPRVFDSQHNPDRSTESGRRQYNPYQDLNIPYRTIYDLPTSPEYLFQEEALAQRRSWGENLTYYTGVGYLAGAAGGATVGLRRAVQAAEPGETMKLRLNRVLNSCGHDGRKFGNTLGVIGLLYAGMESGMVAVRDRLFKFYPSAGCFCWYCLSHCSLGKFITERFEHNSFFQ